MTERDEKKALKLFGETDDPTEAGWILPSGKMVRWHDDHEMMARNINNCSRDDMIQQGWIRAANHTVNVYESGIEISADRDPTIPQLRRICEMIEQTDAEIFLVEWTDKDGKTLTKRFQPDPEEVMYCMGMMNRVGFEKVYQAYKSREEKGETE